MAEADADFALELVAKVHDLIRDYHADPANIETVCGWWKFGWQQWRADDNPATRQILVSTIAYLAILAAELHPDGPVFTEEAMAEVLQHRLEAVPVFLKTLLATAGRLSWSRGMGDENLHRMIGEWLEGQDEATTTCLFSVLLQGLQGVAATGVDEEAATLIQVATQEVLRARDDPAQLRRTWDALAGQDGNLVTQMRVLLMLTAGAAQASGCPGFPGMNAPAVEFTAWQLTAAAYGDQGLLVTSLAEGFFQTCPPEDTYVLAQWLAVRA